MTESLVPVRELPPRPLTVTGCTTEAKVVREAISLLANLLPFLVSSCYLSAWLGFEMWLCLLSLVLWLPRGKLGFEEIGGNKHPLRR